MAEPGRQSTGRGPTGADVRRDLRSGRTRPGPLYLPTVIVLAVLAAAGAVALAGQVLGGPEPRAKWGYTASVLAFLLSTAGAAPILAFATRLAKGYWGIPLRRAAELFALSGLVTVPLFVILLFQLPDWRNRPSIWFDWPGAPQVWDSLAIALLGIAGLALLYLSSIPDLAMAGDTERARRLALGWTGTTRQWRVLTGGIVVLGAFYFMMYAFVHFILVADLAMSLVVGWNSAMMPPFHGISGLQAGVAATVLACWALRRFGGLRPYIGLPVFWGAAKLLLALSLLFFYLSWGEFITYWYGRLPVERDLLELLRFGPYFDLFLLSFTLNFVLPFVLLIWNPIRVSITGPTVVAGLIVVGNLIDRVRWFVASWSVAAPVGTGLVIPASPRYPSLVDGLIVVGAIAAVGLLYLLALRLVPPVSIWEVTGGRLLTVERQYLKARVPVIAKPH